MSVGVSAPFADSRVTRHKRQEGNLSQHDSVAGVGSNFGNCVVKDVTVCWNLFRQ